MKNILLSFSGTCSAPASAAGFTGRARRKSDNTSGLTQAQGSFALIALLTGWGLSDEQVADLAGRLFDAIESGRPGRFQNAINATVKKLRAQQFDVSCHTPHTVIGPETLDISAHVLDLVAPSSSEGVATALSDHVLHTGLDSHVADLTSLRLTFPRLYHAIIKGDVGKAIADVLAGCYHPLNQSSFARLAVVHLKCLLIRTAHNRLATLRDVHVDPYDARFSGFDLFKTSSHIILSTIAGPAGAFLRIAAASRSDKYQQATDEEVIALAIKDRLMSREDTSRLVRLKETSLSRIRVRGDKGMDIRTRNVLAELERRALPSSRLTRGDMKDAGIDRQSIIEHLLGLTPAEAACYVAEELLRACDEIEPLVTSLLAGRKPPRRQSNPHHEKLVGFVANVLRAEAQSDARAPKLKPSQLGLAKEFERINNTGRPQVRSMREKMRSNPQLAKGVRIRLRIDARAWLAR